ncbi:hypothetical protein [Ruegeria arenilitoris]|uniref:hypothetical protein n=1 Tax=Ruegeria arenilitoris TaxID=1173585 RepID=UPI00147F91B5|nr:hypothetical protein [Ruegeria arenilitoris]
MSSPSGLQVLAAYSDPRSLKTLIRKKIEAGHIIEQVAWVPYAADNGLVDALRNMSIVTFASDPCARSNGIVKMEFQDQRTPPNDLIRSIVLLSPEQSDIDHALTVMEPINGQVILINDYDPNKGRSWKTCQLARALG